MERPNTVAGLLEKRREIAARLKVASAEARALQSDLDALDTVIRLFAPEIDGRGVKAKRLPPPHAARKGELQRLIYTTMRETDGPITTIMVAKRFCEARGLEADDRTLTTVRNRVGGTLNKMKVKGAVRQVPLSGDYKGWRLN